MHTLIKNGGCDDVLSHERERMHFHKPIYEEIDEDTSDKKLTLSLFFPFSLVLRFTLFLHPLFFYFALYLTFLVPPSYSPFIGRDSNDKKLA